MSQIQANRLQSISSPGAWLLLALLLVLVIYGVLLGSHTLENTARPAPGALTDADLYQRIVLRMQAGQGYYDAAGAQLREMGFATRPFFNWRTPVLASFLALLPGEQTARVLMTLLAWTTLATWIAVLKQGGTWWLTLVGGVLLLPSLGITGLTPFHHYHEAWSGLCVALSLGLWARGSWRASVLLGVLAVFTRELALPYLVVMLAGAAWERRKAEAWAWAGGIVAFAVFLGIHAWIVSWHLTGAERTHEGWLQCGGWPFVLCTARCNPVLLISPGWLVGIVLPLSLLGLTAWSDPTGTRLALIVGSFVIAYMLVGRTVNVYWGLVYAPLLPLGLLLAPKALADLLRAARGILQAHPWMALPSEHGATTHSK